MIRNLIDYNVKDYSLGVDSSYHVRTKVSVKRGVIWDISIDGIREGEVWLPFGVYIQKCY